MIGTENEEAKAFVAYLASRNNNPDLKSAYISQVKEVLVAAAELHGSLDAMRKELEQKLKRRGYEFNSATKWKSQVGIIDTIRQYEKNHQINALYYIDAIPGTPDICYMV
jgi:ABC-type uncharacterized transport system substrate-binding protein